MNEDEESLEEFNRWPCAFIPDLTYGEYERFGEKDEDSLRALVDRHMEIRISHYEGKRLPKHRLNKKNNHLP